MAATKVLLRGAKRKFVALLGAGVLSTRLGFGEQAGECCFVNGE
jgi:hypothetical protein